MKDPIREFPSPMDCTPGTLRNAWAWQYDIAHSVRREHRGMRLKRRMPGYTAADLAREPLEDLGPRPE